jgi:hypothetical protein
MTQETKQALWRALKRFGRVFVGGAIGAMALIPINGADLKTYLLTLAGVGIGGGIVALDKFLRDFKK